MSPLGNAISVAPDSRRRRPLLRVFLVGAAVGAGAGAVVLSSGVLDVFFTPLWQEILFAPGLAAGWGFYNCCHHWWPTDGNVPEIIVGFIVTALEYGTIGVGLALGWRWLRRGSQHAAT